MGNEVWGFAHMVQMPLAVKPRIIVNYALWARKMTTEQLKASPYFNPDKMFVSFSGRSPADNYGLHERCSQMMTEKWTCWISVVILAVT